MSLSSTTGTARPSRRPLSHAGGDAGLLERALGNRLVGREAVGEKPAGRRRRAARRLRGRGRRPVRRSGSRGRRSTSRENDVGAGDAEERAQEGECPAVVAVSVRRIPEVAPVAVRVRRSPALSLGSVRRSSRGWRAPGWRPRPVAMAMTLRIRGLASRWTSIVRPAFAATSRASAICSLVRGRLDSTSQPPRSAPAVSAKSTECDEARRLPRLAEPRSCWADSTSGRSPGRVPSAVMLRMTSPSAPTLRSARKSCSDRPRRDRFLGTSSSAGVATYSSD